MPSDQSRLSENGSAAAPAASQPSSNLLGNLRVELSRYIPFAQMQADHLDRLIAAAEQVYFAPGETVLAPADGPPRHLICIRQGHITGRRAGDETAAGFEYEAGDLFPVGALMGERPVEATYRAQGDVFCLLLPAEVVREVTAQSAPFANFLGHRALRYLELSRKAMQATYSSQTLEEQSLETSLGQLSLTPPVAVRPETPLSEALATMHERHVGSVLVVDAIGAAQGILTRNDILGRVTLAQVPLSTPISQVMTTPVLTLSVRDTAHDAALLMTRHAIGHVPVARDGRIIGLVSERDLFAMQRLSPKQLGTAIRAASDVDALAAAAQDIRRFAYGLIAHGVAARQLTQLVSHLNDLLTEQAIRMLARDESADLSRACWLAFDSEGRAEQTIVTYQYNGLVFASDAPERDRPRWIEFARRVNETLARCGCPPCNGNAMASNPQCCLTPDEWGRRFDRWMEARAAEDLLEAGIYFDLRPLAGQTELARPLRELIVRKAPRLREFVKLMAGNALRSRPPLNWLGAIETRAVEGRAMVDLKQDGSAVFVDVARVYALAHGIAHTGTRERFEALGTLLGVPLREGQAWVAGFEYLQMLRLQAQLAHAGDTPENANLVELQALNDLDRRMLKESFRVARRLQRNMEIEYQR